jgi:hypothetical protein
MHPAGMVLRHVTFYQWLQFIRITFYKMYHLNIKHNYRVHKYDTRGSHDPHVSDFTTSLYGNGVLNMGIKLYDKLPEK